MFLPMCFAFVQFRNQNTELSMLANKNWKPNLKTPKNGTNKFHLEFVWLIASCFTCIRVQRKMFLWCHSRLDSYVFRWKLSDNDRNYSDSLHRRMLTESFVVSKRKKKWKWKQMRKWWQKKICEHFCWLNNFQIKNNHFRNCKSWKFLFTFDVIIIHFKCNQYS